MMATVQSKGFPLAGLLTNVNPQNLIKPIGTDSYSNYYATQTKLAASRPYQLASSGGQPQITNSTHINTVNVNSNPQSVDALNESIKRQSQRASTNAAFSSSVNR